jgi:hypothetical protein
MLKTLKRWLYINSFSICRSTTGWILIKSRWSLAWSTLMFVVYSVDTFYWINWNYMRYTGHYRLHITWASFYLIHRTVRDFHCVVEKRFSEAKLSSVFKLQIFILLRAFVLFNLWETEVLNTLLYLPLPESIVPKTAMFVFIKFRIEYFVLITFSVILPCEFISSN